MVHAIDYSSIGYFMCGFNITYYSQRGQRTKYIWLYESAQKDSNLKFVVLHIHMLCKF